MEQQIVLRSTSRAGSLTYATYGEGPPLVIGPRWVSHLEEEWAEPAQRAFYEEVARTYQVVRFDRIGCGLSSRELSPRPTVESESRQLEAVIGAVGGTAVVFASSCFLAASQLAVRSPSAVERLVYFGGYASRGDIPEADEDVVDPVHRGRTGRLGAQMLAGLFDPHASGDEIAVYTRMQRAAASAEAASLFLELDLRADLRDVLPHVTRPRARVAPPRRPGRSDRARARARRAAAAGTIRGR